ncbi:MAG: PD40 domain-containing protein, partial [Ignavibacteriales bacterium]|nr:PD40 domain-containing protein [Ignavibacteriales bacterium]
MKLQTTNYQLVTRNLKVFMRSTLYYIILALFIATTASAQFYYFGRNKVQYTEFEWKVLRTEHFDIYYYTEMKELAERGAFLAEESYKVLEQKFNHNVGNRIPLIFYSSHLHFEQTNTTPGFIPEGVGGFFEFLKGRVVIPFDGTMERFAHVIRHELVHVFMHSKLNRVLLDHRQSQDRSAPLWFTEGLAECWSTQWDTQAEMVMRDAVLNNYVVPLNDMDRIYGSFLMYKEGENLLRFIEERYGPEKTLLLMENFWKVSTFSEVMKLTIGKTYKEFDEDWLYYLKKRYYPIMRQEDLPSGVTKNIIDVGFNSKPVFYKHNGKREVYFIGNHIGYTNIYRADLDAEKPEPKVVIEGEKTDEFEAFHLFQSKLDISKDGLLAFVTKSGETDALHVYNINEDKLQETFRFKNLVVLGSPSWSPDGKKIVFTSIDKSGNNDLYILELGSRSLTRLTNDFYDDRDPAWSPDGKVIAFSSDRTSHGKSGKHNLFLYHLADASIEYLTIGDENYNSPSWSSDGKKILFTSDLDGAQNIWMMDVRQGESSPGVRRSMKKLTSFSTAAFDPSWGEGNELIFTAFENFSFQIKNIKDAQAIADSSKISHTFQYISIGEPWVASKVESP